MSIRTVSISMKQAERSNNGQNDYHESSIKFSFDRCDIFIIIRVFFVEYVHYKVFTAAAFKVTGEDGAFWMSLPQDDTLMVGCEL